MNSKLLFKVVKRIKSVSGIKIFVIFTVATLDLAVVLLGRVTLQIMRMSRCWRLRHYGFSIEVWELDVING